MNIRIDLEIKYSAENGSYFRVAEKLNLFCLWGIHLWSISSFFFFLFLAAQHAIAKLISFTEDYIKKIFSINLNLLKLWSSFPGDRVAVGGGQEHGCRRSWFEQTDYTIPRIYTPWNSWAKLFYLKKLQIYASSSTLQSICNGINARIIFGIFFLIAIIVPFTIFCFVYSLYKKNAVYAQRYF